MEREFLLYGERCTGTNVVQSLVENNFNMKVSWRFRYKHWPEIDGNQDEVDLPIVIVTRNPFSYFSSLYRMPWHAPEEIRKLDFSNFLRSEWWNVYNEEVHVGPDDARYGKEMPRELFHQEGRRYKNVIEMRGTKLRQLADIFNSKSQRIVVVDFEELRSDQVSVVNRLSRTWKIAKRYSNARIISDYKGADSWRRRMFNLMTIGFFRKQVTRRDIIYAASDIDFVLENLDFEVESFFGYRPWATDLYV